MPMTLTKSWLRVELIAQDSPCWITERGGGESVIEQFNPFNHIIQVLYQCELSSNNCRVNKQ
jgi:hypothetical protein